MAAESLLVVAVGGALVCAALVLASRARRRRMALLLLAAGVTWWLGGLGDWALFWHRGPLTHALLAHPTGRLRGRVARLVVLGGYVLAIAAPLDRVEGVEVGYAMVVVTAVTWSAVRAPRQQRTQRWQAAAVAALVMGALGVGAVVRARSLGAQPGTLRAYELALVVGSLALAAGDAWDRWSQPAATRLVVELGAAAPAVGRIGGLVAEALGDPSAQLFYWLPDSAGFVDEAGRPMPDGVATPGRTATALEHDGERVGVLVHDAGVGRDRDLLGKVATLASLAIAGVRLRADVEAQLVAVEQSRRRLVSAADLERQQLAAEVREGAAHRLTVVSERLAHSAHRRPDLAEAAALAQQSLDSFAAGVDPLASSVDGLAGTLRELVRDFPVQATLHVSGARSSPPAESSAYFVCAEALSNIGKHAAASHVDIHVEASTESVRVVVTDDGVGGASLSAGTGLAGLRDRVEALGGTFTVDSPVAGGTRVAAVIPA